MFHAIFVWHDSKLAGMQHNTPDFFRYHTIETYIYRVNIRSTSTSGRIYIFCEIVSNHNGFVFGCFPILSNFNCFWMNILCLCRIADFRLKHSLANRLDKCVKCFRLVWCTTRYWCLCGDGHNVLCMMWHGCCVYCWSSNTFWLNAFHRAVGILENYTVVFWMLKFMRKVTHISQLSGLEWRIHSLGCRFSLFTIYYLLFVVL